jgi:hypothetical protein
MDMKALSYLPTKGSTKWGKSSNDDPGGFIEKKRKQMTIIQGLF